MKKLIVLVSMAMVGASFAHADTVLVDRHSYGYEFRGAEYRFNAEEGSVRAVLRWDERLDTMHGPSFRPLTETRTVSGLSFDAAASQIVFTGNVGKVVCATVTHNGNKAWIRPTESCSFYKVSENGGLSVYFDAE